MVIVMTLSQTVLAASFAASSARQRGRMMCINHWGIEVSGVGATRGVNTA